MQALSLIISIAALFISLFTLKEVTDAKKSKR